MSLDEYFEHTKGLGILGTSDSSGKVDLAIYARPHVVDEETIGFIMSDRLSHRNLESNPNAAYMFVEQGEGYVGKRMYLTKLREETDPELVTQMRRERGSKYGARESKSYLVYFRINSIRPLVGN